MRLTPRLANTIADCYVALRTAGFSQDEAARIITLESDYQIGLILEAKFHGQRRDHPHDLERAESGEDRSQAVG